MNPAKKLKCADPDLQVEVGPEKKVFEYHSLFLAYQSPYIDSMLAAPMRESESKRISFPEISPDVWEKMMKYLQDGRDDMTFEDAEQLIPLYDKYQFEQGLSIVDKFLAKEVCDQNTLNRMQQEAEKYIQHGSWSNQHPMDWLVKRLRMGQDYALDKAKETCLLQLKEVLGDSKARLMIFVKHWILLAPFVVQDGRLWIHVERVLVDVGEANKENFVKASQTGESKVIFKLLRAQFEKEYAESKGVRIP
jgi:hypothetical protein